MSAACRWPARGRGRWRNAIPCPTPEPWRAIGDPRERLRQGLAAIYDWNARNAQLMSSLMRDVEHHALTQEIMRLRSGPRITAFHQVLGAGLGPRQRAMLVVALSFFTWRTLARDAGLAPAAAVDAMVRAACDQPAG